MTEKSPNNKPAAANQSFGEIEFDGEADSDQSLSLDRNASPKPTSDVPPQAFGELDLGGAEDDPIPNLGGQSNSSKPKPQKIRRAALSKAPAVGEDMDLEKTVPRTGPRPAQRKARPRPQRPEPEIQLPRRSYKKPILITLLVLVVLGALGGGVYGVLQ